MDPSILDYYNRAPEESRLQAGASQLEAERTRELIARHIASPPATVIDVGGAAGAYSLWLAEQGYDVHLIDATPRLVDVAASRSAVAKHRLASCRVGDARQLDLASDGADAVLLLGPLYHLHDASHRAQAIREAARVLRPGGLLFAAGISRWASTLDGLSRELLRDPHFKEIVRRDLADGRHVNETSQLDYFTTAYFHKPDELRQEIGVAGLSVVALYGIEGPGWMLSDFDDRWRDPARRSVLLDAARLVESEPAMVGSSAHMLAVARKA